MYGTMPHIKRILNPAPTGTYISGAILIGTATGSVDAIMIGSTFAYQCNNEAGTLVDGMLVKRYKVPFSAPYPGEVKSICERLAAALITFSAKQYTADVASNFLYDKQQQNYQLAISKLQALADGVEDLKDQKVESYPKGEFATSDKFHFALPGSSDVRPAAGM